MWYRLCFLKFTLRNKWVDFDTKQKESNNKFSFYYFSNRDGLSNTPSRKKRIDAIDGQRQRLQFSKDNGFLRAYEHEYNKPSCIALELQAINDGLISDVGVKQSLQKRLRKSLHDQKITLNEYAWLYELAYPCLMKLYWTKEAIKNRIKAVI